MFSVSLACSCRPLVGGGQDIPLAYGLHDDAILSKFRQKDKRLLQSGYPGDPLVPVWLEHRNGTRFRKSLFIL